MIKHSISFLTCTSFMKTLRYIRILYDYSCAVLIMTREDPTAASPTITEDSESQKVEVSLPFDWVPPDVRVPPGHQHLAALQSAASQISHDLRMGQDGAGV